MKVIGRPSDVEVTRYLYSFFQRQVDALMAQHCKGQSSTYKGEFCIGCIQTLDDKLVEQEKSTVAEVKVKHAGNEMALVRVDGAVARIERRKQDVADFLERPSIEFISRRIAVPFDLAKLLWNFDFKAAAAKFPELFDAAKERWDAYLEDCHKSSGGRCGSRSFDGAGSKITTGGREAGRKAGQSIRMTSSKGLIGGGQ